MVYGRKSKDFSRGLRCSYEYNSCDISRSDPRNNIRGQKEQDS
jgi:hypothetical protein